MLPEKECGICGIIFQPTRANQKYCPSCRKNPEQKKREYDRALKRSIREYGYGRQESVFFDSKCAFCGQIFQNITFRQRNFCSDECEKKWILANVRCSNCGKRITEEDTLPRNWNSIWYCSWECKHEVWMQKQIEEGNTHPCPVCGKVTLNSKVYCGQECYEKGRNRAKAYRYTCPHCGKQGVSNVPKTFCGKECYQAAVKAVWKPKQASSHRKAANGSGQRKNPVPTPIKKESEQEKMIRENGLCSVCRTPYADCIRMTSGFRYLPEGAKSPDGKKITSCPSYTAPRMKK